MGVPSKKDHPIIEGLTALVVVSLGLALVISVGAAVAASVVGSGRSSAGSDSTGQASLYLPKPTINDLSAGPLISAGPLTPTATTEDTAPATQIVLEAGQTQVAPMQQIDLSGSFPDGEGAVLQVQRFSDGAWRDFNATMSVTSGRFSTYIFTSQAGVNRLRVVDSDTDAVSNEVKITVG